MKIRHWCSTIGLEAIDIEPKRFDTVIEYINDIGVDLMTSSPIPLGYDYKCLKEKCDGVFRSFSSSLSEDITKVLVERLDPKNLAN
jgi:hypothetical protein